jgi:hypothetical protein
LIKTRFIFSLAVAFAILINPATALEGFLTCHAAGATVTRISGFDTRTAKMVSVMTLPDAMAHCHGNIGHETAGLAKAWGLIIS